MRTLSCEFCNAEAKPKTRAKRCRILPLGRYSTPKALWKSVVEVIEDRRVSPSAPWYEWDIMTPCEVLISEGWAFDGDSMIDTCPRCTFNGDVVIEGGDFNSQEGIISQAIAMGMGWLK
jgi:hypothetical protein